MPTTRTPRSSRALLRFLMPMLLLALCSLGARAVDDPDFSPGSHERFATRVNTAQSTDYHAILALYDAHRAAHPDDALSAIERCRFIEVFAYVEGVTIESANDDLTACREELKASLFAGNVEVILYGVESSWGEAEAASAEALIPQSKYWTNAQRAKLYELLTQKKTWQENDLAATYAMRAVELDPGTSVLMTAVHRWVQLGAKDKAHKVLMAAPDSTWEKASRTEAAQVLLELGDVQLAVKLLKGAKATPNDLTTMRALAHALAASGEIPAARENYRKALEAKYVAMDTRIEYFEFEREHGTASAAADAYRTLRNEGYVADPLAYHRLSLLLSHPSVGWEWRDALGVLTALALALSFCLVPLLVIVPVHYRGLALRASNRTPVAAPNAWTLRHAWYALGMFELAQIVILYVFAPSYLEAALPWVNHFTPASATTDRVLARILLYGNIAILVLLVPLLRGKHVLSILRGRWSIGKSVLVGIGAALLLKIATVIVLVGVNKLGVLGSDTSRAIQGAHESYGLAVMLLLTAGITPLVEEWIFRGVLLQAFRGHVSFVLAATMQAAAFTLLHEEWQSMPFLFVFALVAAWLAKRSEGLLAPIAMHSVNNLMASLAIVGFTNVLNR